MFSTPIVIDIKVKIPALAIVTIQIPKFHVNTFDPSRFPIGNKLKTARKLLIEYPTEQMANINNEVSEVNADLYTAVAIAKKTNASMILTTGPAIDILPLISSVM